MSNVDLWGDIPIENGIKLPVTILKEQATILGEKTDKILEAKVNSVNVADKDIVGYELKIIAPALSNFSYGVLSVFHSLVLVYPLNMSHQNSTGKWTTSKCKDEAEFTAKLREILSSEVIHTVIVSLISQSKAAV
ncbi:MAG TPA: hypothetical protein VF721_10630 [Pyrinomonadaceae bacterium]|jgi:hypothetical protein